MANAAAGQVVQAAARESERLRRKGEQDEADLLLSENTGELISPEYAAKQAKALATQLHAIAGGGAAAAQVKAKLINLPEIRALEGFLAFAEEGELTHVELPQRLLDNLVTFVSDRLGTEGTRHGEDQNVHNAILTAVMDGKMLEDKLIAAVAKMLDVAWAVAKRAIERRVKMEDEDVERSEASPSGATWHRVKRATRCDEYELPGFIQFQHDETFFRFSSRRSTPLRKWVAVGKYEVSMCSPHISSDLA